MICGCVQEAVQAFNIHYPEGLKSNNPQLDTANSKEGAVQYLRLHSTQDCHSHLLVDCLLGSLGLAAKTNNHQHLDCAF